MASPINKPRVNMINVDKAHSALIKNSNRYWINKHRLGVPVTGSSRLRRSAGLSIRVTLNWQSEYWALNRAPPPVSRSERGEQKAERQDIIPVALFPIQCITFRDGQRIRSRLESESFDPSDQTIPWFIQSECSESNLWPTIETGPSTWCSHGIRQHASSRYWGWPLEKTLPR